VLFVLNLGCLCFVSSAAGNFCKKASGCSGGCLPGNSICRTWWKHLNHGCMVRCALCACVLTHGCCMHDLLACMHAATQPACRHVWLGFS
jgi:hypothetical protein